MIDRETFLQDALGRFLGRKSVPDRLRGEAKAGPRADEMSALIRSVLRNAPTHASAEDWWPRIADWLDDNVGHAGWPSTSQVKDAADALRAEDRDRAGSNRALLPVRSASQDSADAIPLDVRAAAGRIRRGEPVSEYALWGRQADTMLEAGLVTYDELGPYRDSITRDWTKLYGPERAAELEEERKSSRPTTAGRRDYETGGIIGAATKRFPEPRPPYQPTREELLQARYSAGTMEPPPPATDAFNPQEEYRPDGQI